jgi:GNAT superfamily N-acetyltransferase
MLSIRSLCGADLSTAAGLSRAAGWNQNEADWRRMMEMEPAGAFLALWSGAPAGTALACTYGPVGWIAMVLVDDKLRRRGIGGELMRRALALLDERGVRSVRLDATPLGQPLYVRLGFRAEYFLARHAGVLAAGTEFVASEVEPFRVEFTQALLELDRRVTGADRSKFLHRAFTERPESVRLVRSRNGLAGYAMARPGARALMLGPCLCDARAGPLLFADALWRHTGQQVYIDVPVGRLEAERLLQEKGLTVERRLLRMVRGEPTGEQIHELWASSGPEKG